MPRKSKNTEKFKGWLLNFLLGLVISRVEKLISPDVIEGIRKFNSSIKEDDIDVKRAKIRAKAKELWQKDSDNIPEHLNDLALALVMSKMNL